MNKILNLLVLASLFGACQPKQTVHVMPNPDDFVRVEGPNLITPKGRSIWQNAILVFGLRKT